jgi:predicted Zn finger-like uncharacterized protein
MRLVCPKCQAAYDVPDTRLGGKPRRLRCTRCAHEWMVEPPPPLPPPPVSPLRPAAPLVAAAAAHPPQAAFPDYTEDKTSDRGALAAWAVSVLLVTGLALAAVYFREDVMRLWPPSQRLYALFGAVPP